VNVRTREAVILAGGRSERMGCDKALLVVGDRTMLGRLLDVLGARFERVIVALASDRSDATEERCARAVVDSVLAIVDGARARGKRVDIVRDERPGRLGPLAGVEAALRVLEGDRAFFIAVDAAAVSDVIVQALERVLHEAPLGAVPIWRDHAQGAYAIYARALLPRVSAMLDGGERRLGSLADLDGVGRVAIDDDAERVFRPLNTPADLAAWRAAVSIEGPPREREPR